MARSVVAFAAVLLTLSTGTVIANSEKFDKSVAEAAARIAAEKIGELRNAIGFEEKPDMVSHADGQEQVDEIQDDQSIIWIAPEKDEPDRITDAGHLDVDQTLTGSVGQKEPNISRRTFWEWFDGNGNPVKRPY